jgi:hypothetical protein
MSNVSLRTAMIRIVFLLIIFSANGISTFAQGLSTQTHRTIGVNIHTTGWGVNYAHFYNKPKGKIDGLNFDYMTQNVFGERKENRETIANSRLVINKINQLYYLRAGVIKRFEMGVRQNKSNIGVNALLSAGPLLAFYKPVYVQYSDSDSAAIGISDVRYTPTVHSASQIFGKSSFGTGIGQTKVKMGAYFKSALRFDWGSYEGNFKALEVGFNLQWVNNPEIIINGIDRQGLQANLFVMISFGKIME